MRLLCLCCCALVLAACAGSREGALPPPVALDDLLARAYEQTPDGRLALLEPLGRPLRNWGKPTPNRHVAGQVDTLRTLVYEGLEVQVYETADERELLQTLRVTSPRYRTAEGLTVGSPREDVHAALGAPEGVEAGQDTFAIGSDPDGPPLDLVVEYEAGRVSALVWRFYMD
jgi:hypothetical protein